MTIEDAAEILGRTRWSCFDYLRNRGLPTSFGQEYVTAQGLSKLLGTLVSLESWGIKPDYTRTSTRTKALRRYIKVSRIPEIIASGVWMDLEPHKVAAQYRTEVAKAQEGWVRIRDIRIQLKGALSHQAIYTIIKREGFEWVRGRKWAWVKATPNEIYQACLKSQRTSN